MNRALGLVVLLIVIALAGLHFVGSGMLGEDWTAGSPTPGEIPAEVIESRETTQRDAALEAGVVNSKQGLFRPHSQQFRAGSHRRNLHD